MASKFQFITELYSRTLTKLTGDYESWTGFLRAACYNYKCPFDEQVLIYAQRPNATGGAGAGKMEPAVWPVGQRRGYRYCCHG